MSYTCLVCGYDEMTRDPNSLACFEICPSCDFEFGVTDRDLGFTFEQWRKKWIKEDMKWHGIARTQPQNWDPKRQLLNIGVKI